MCSLCFVYVYMFISCTVVCKFLSHIILFLYNLCFKKKCIVIYRLDIIAIKPVVLRIPTWHARGNLFDILWMFYDLKQWSQDLKEKILTFHIAGREKALKDIFVFADTISNSESHHSQKEESWTQEWNKNPAQDIKQKKTFESPWIKVNASIGFRKRLPFRLFLCSYFNRHFFCSYKEIKTFGGGDAIKKTCIKCFAGFILSKMMSMQI